METTHQVTLEEAPFNETSRDAFEGIIATAMAGNRTRILLEKPTIKSLDKLAMSQLLVRVGPVDRARGYQVQVSSENGWLDAGVYAQDGRIVLGNLVPGLNYKIRARALGFSSSCSEWSDSLSLVLN
jgi:hypothetical protein